MTRENALNDKGGTFWVTRGKVLKDKLELSG